MPSIPLRLLLSFSVGPLLDPNSCFTVHDHQRGTLENDCQDNKYCDQSCPAVLRLLPTRVRARVMPALGATTCYRTDEPPPPQTQIRLTATFLSPTLPFLMGLKYPVWQKALSLCGRVQLPNLSGRRKGCAKSKTTTYHNVNTTCYMAARSRILFNFHEWKNVPQSCTLTYARPEPHYSLD